MASPFNIDIRPRRLPVEIKQIEEASKEHGIHCKVHDDSYEYIVATIPGPKETPYENIEFKLSLEFGIQYPFRPPVIKFITPVYHPNIDIDGKICLDVLQMPPGGSYNPAITLESILLSIQLLLASPNADDPLRNDVSDEYRYNRVLFNEQAAKLSGSKETSSQSKASPTKEITSTEKDIEANPSYMADGTESKNDPKTDGETSATKISRKRKHDGT